MRFELVRKVTPFRQRECWSYRIVAGNGEVLAVSEKLANRAHAERMIAKIRAERAKAETTVIE
jgi:uncharacterized protein YegP (UPF0339 family)